MSVDPDGPIDDRATLLPAETPGRVETARPLLVWTVFAVFLATLVACIAVQIPVVIALVAIKVGGGSSPEAAVEAISAPGPGAFIATALPAQLAILAAWWLALSFGDPRAKRYRAIGKASLPWPAYFCFAWATLGVFWLGGLLGQAGVWLLGNWQSGFVAGIYKSMTWPIGIVFVLFIALMPAFAEELFFRGYMQRRLLARWSPAVAIPVVAIVFAAFHGTPVWALTVLPLGLWLGTLAWRTTSLWPGIVCHSFVNGSVNLWRVGAALGVLPQNVPPAVYYIVIAIGLAFLGFSGWFLFRYRRSGERSHA